MNPSFVRRRTAILAVFVMLWAGGVQAQSAPEREPAKPPPNLHLVAVGGLLGQFDGFCEPPGGPYDLPLAASTQACLPGGPGGQPSTGSGEKPEWPAALGGLLGARNWIDGLRKTPAKNAPALLLIQGNNQTADFANRAMWASQPQKPAAPRETEPERVERARYAQKPLVQDPTTQFWTSLNSLKPTAVGLGSEDFFRSLRVSLLPKEPLTIDEADTAARRFVNWVSGQMRADLPLLASNVVVTTSGPGTNTVRTAGSKYALDLDETASVAWVKEFTIAHPCGIVPVFMLEAASSPDGSWRPVPIAPVKTDDCATTVAPTDGALQPATHYKVSYRLAGTAGAQRTGPASGEVGRFLTHASLTPATPHMSTLTGWPVIERPLGKDEAPGEKELTDLLIVSFVSETTALGLGKSVWTWNPKEKTTSRIQFLKPVETMATILEKVMTVRKRLPFIVLMSQLDDDETVELLEAFPEIRVAVLPPDSLLLGRASRQTLPNFSGDYGMLGSFDGPVPTVTRVLTRPEWVAETGASILANISFGKDSNDTWQWSFALGFPSKVDTIPGFPLHVAAVPNQPEQVAYAVTDPAEPGKPHAESGGYISYLACAAEHTQPLCDAYRSIWRDRATLLAVAADALRHGAKADVVVMPTGLVDPDAIAWLKNALGEGNTSWLSKFILQRVVFRSYRFVRVDVAGEQLPALLQKVLGDPLGLGEEYCLAGLGAQAGCPSTLDGKALHKLRIDGRVIRPRLFYSVVLPDSLAEKENLSHRDDSDDSFDALDQLDRHLTSGSWYPRVRVKPPDTLTRRLEEGATGRVKQFISLAEAEFGWSGLDADAPGGGDTIPNNVDFESRGARSRSNKNVIVKFEAVPFDMKRFALRGLIDLDYKSERILANEVTSYDRDRMLAGARVDIWKVRTLGDLRPFVGYFWEGPIKTHESELTATRELGRETRDGGLFITSEAADFKTHYVVKRNTYRHLAVGADILVNAIGWIGENSDVTFKRAKLEWNTGRASRVPIDLQVNDPSGVEMGRLAAVRSTGACASSKNDQIRSGDAPALLNAFFTCFPDALLPLSTVQVVTDKRDQTRTQMEVEGAATFKYKGRTYKFNAFHQRRYYSVKGEPTDLAIRRTWRVELQFTLPLFWRFEAAPTYDYQRAFISAAERNQFSVHQWSLRIKVPLFVGLGKRPFMQ